MGQLHGPTHLLVMSQVAAHRISTVATTVDRAAAGDHEAFARLIAEHHGDMMRVAHVITGDSESASDAVQSAWEIAWRKLGGLRDRSQVRAWLVAIAADEAGRRVGAHVAWSSSTSLTRWNTRRRPTPAMRSR